MSKRRSNGSVIVPSRRRKRDDAEDFLLKRARTINFSCSQPPCESLLGKRKAFDDELTHLHKRLRVLPPRFTPEQVAAALLPHLLRIQSLYVNSLQRVKQLEQHNKVLANAVHTLNESNIELTNELNTTRRELDLCKWRFLATQPVPHLCH
jgi:hypothetical protein